MKSLVLLFWACIIAAIVYRYRTTEPMREFGGGISDIWSAVVHAKVPERLDTFDGQEGSYQFGIIAGIISVVVAGLVTLCIAGYTLYLAR